MRIIAGKYKGRRLGRPPRGVRPTSDRLREALFSHLGSKVEETRWLDAFAGSGAVGIEALSRGAREVVFNDPDPAAASLIERNLRHCGVEEGYEVRQLDVFRLLRLLRGRHFDYVFLDPPYAFPRYRRLLRQTAAQLDLKAEDRTILEVFKKADDDLIPGEWERLRTLRAGDSHLWILRKSSANTS